MIKLPWLQEEWRRRPNDDSTRHLKSCDRCKEIYPDAFSRQQQACGWEPPLEGAIAWDHPERDPRPFEKDLPQVCPGYTCSLPEVHEIVDAFGFKESGELTQFCGGLAPQPLIDAISLLGAETNRMQSWSMRNPEPEKK